VTEKQGDNNAVEEQKQQHQQHQQHQQQIHDFSTYPDLYR
jgi:hypothetical protein